MTPPKSVRDGEAPLGRRSGLRRALLFGGAGAVALVAIVGGVLLALSPRQGPAPRPVATPPSEPAVAAPADAGEAKARAEVAEAPTEERPPPEDAAPLEAKVRKRGVGVLEVNVTPWAEVYEGRRRVGVTPMAPFELPVGKHVLTFKNAQLGVTRQVTVTVKRGKRDRLDVDLTE